MIGLFIPKRLFIGCPVGCFFIKRYGCRTCAVIGGLTAAVGFGLGVSYTAGMAVLNIYFDKFKTLATELASIGQNTGLVIYARLVIYLEESYGWRGMMLIHGAIAFNLCVCACAMFPLKIEERLKAEDFLKTNDEFKGKKKKMHFVNVKLFKKTSFIMFCASNIFVNTSSCIYILHLPSYLKEAGFTQGQLGTVLMVFGISNFVGKVIYSLLGQHPRIDETSLYTVSLTAAGVSVFLTPMFLTKAGVMTTAGLAGFFHCVTGALLHAVIYGIVGFERFADGIGLSLPFKAVGNLIGGPLAGLMLTTTGDYAFSFYLSGVSMVIASLLMIQPVLNHRCRGAQTRNKVLYTVRETDIG
ncbi:monocarboxylate transporter 14-like [Mercenaria mercenaria]|uniref:monocarboxylate transporter 14-like n=1 Tax=Mercenaria mercenaria TaxID=6596 RepID=UPI00234F4687|nr:monocarboxylate transporter 14-like [Mercenaria mercenaria]